MTTGREHLAPGHWSRHAPLWSYIGPPLRPSQDDARSYRRGFESWIQATGRSDPIVLVLGATPEVCRLPLDTDGLVIPVERSAEMIRSVWPGRIRPRDRMIRADWRWMPLASSTIDLVLADVPFCGTSYPSGYLAVCAELRRVLRPGGRFVTRCCVQPERRETIDEVFEDLLDGRIGNFHALKWRLTMALQPDADTGVPIGDVWDTLHAAWADLDVLAARFGWPIEEVRTIEVYRGVTTRYTFPTLAQHQELFEAAAFTVIEAATPSYELGERFPVLQLAGPR